MRPKLIFVYNGDSGLFNGLLHYVHKKVSPETYDCQLCALVYDGMSMNRDWLAFLQTLEADTEFLHRDSYEKQYGRLSQDLPAVFQVDAQGHRQVIDASRIRRLDSLASLQQAVGQLLAQA